MTYSLRIADIPESERPRERLMAQGAKNLATAELIAILLGTGQGQGKLSAVGLGQYILQQVKPKPARPDGGVTGHQPSGVDKYSWCGTSKGDNNSGSR
jgi:DNA repair protein RadC